RRPLWCAGHAPVPTARHPGRAIRTKHAGGNWALAGRAPGCVWGESSSGGFLFWRNGFVEDQHAVGREVVVALQDGAGQKIVHGFVKLDAHGRILVVEE